MIFINNQGKQRKIAKYSLLFVSGKKAILSYERYACFHSDWQRYECRPSFAFVS